MHKNIEIGKKILMSKEAAVSDKYDALFYHHDWNTEEALAALREAYPYLDNSELLEHEVMYLLGQHVSESSLDFLLNILNSPTEAPIVRHESVEALSNFVDFKDRVIPELLKHLNSDVHLLRLTIPLAIRKLETFSNIKNNYNKDISGAIEPEESFTEEELGLYLKSIGKTDADLLEVLFDEKVEEFIKHRILHTLFDRDDKASAMIMSKLLLKENQAKTTALIRHEVGFVLGDMQDSARYDEIRNAIQECVENPDEEPMVKHEIIIAYIQLWGVDAFIEKQKQHPCRLIRESAHIGMH